MICMIHVCILIYIYHYQANSTEARRIALIEACAGIFDVDGDRVLSRREMKGLWHALQLRALDPVLTSREFYMVLQVRVFRT